MTPQKTKRPGAYAYHEHPVLLLPSGPDKVWASRSHRSESFRNITQKSSPWELVPSVTLRQIRGPREGLGARKIFPHRIGFTANHQN